MKFKHNEVYQKELDDQNKEKYKFTKIIDQINKGIPDQKLQQNHLNLPDDPDDVDQMMANWDWIILMKLPETTILI